MDIYSKKKFAKVTPAKGLTLSGNPNYVIFESLNNTERDPKSYVSFDVNSFIQYLPYDDLVAAGQLETVLQKYTRFSIGIPDLDINPIFQGTCDKNKVDNRNFLIVKPNEHPYMYTPQEAHEITIQNIKACILENPVFRSNYFVEIDIYGDRDLSIEVRPHLKIVAKNSGQQHNLDLSYEKPEELKFTDKESVDHVINISDWEPFISYVYTSEGSSSDTIDRGRGDCSILLDVYKCSSTFLGNNFKGFATKGNHLVTLSKSYFGQPLWFELNGLFDKSVGYSSEFLDASSWVDTGTAEVFMLEALFFDGTSRRLVYCSDPLYVLKGYDYLLENSDLMAIDEKNTSHTHDFHQDFYKEGAVLVRPLTNLYERTHIKGQSQYFNFIHKHADHGFELRPHPGPQPPLMGLKYKLYTQSGNYITEYLDHAQEEKMLHVVNTVKLSLDKYLPQAKDAKGRMRTVGRIDVYMVQWVDEGPRNEAEPEVIVSTPLSYTILPEHLHSVNDFAFLNRLGGWDSFSFGGDVSKEYKTTASTVFNTLLPDAKIHSTIEKVAHKVIDEQITVQTSPVPYSTVEWLRELSASPAVYELKTKKYIVVDTMTLKYSTKEDLFQVEMKYHYSDTPKL